MTSPRPTPFLARVLVFVALPPLMLWAALWTLGGMLRDEIIHVEHRNKRS